MATQQLALAVWQGYQLRTGMVALKHADGSRMLGGGLAGGSRPPLLERMSTGDDFGDGDWADRASLVGEDLDVLLDDALASPGSTKRRGSFSGTAALRDSLRVDSGGSGGGSDDGRGSFGDSGRGSVTFGSGDAGASSRGGGGGGGGGSNKPMSRTQRLSMLSAEVRDAQLEVAACIDFFGAAARLAPYSYAAATGLAAAQEELRRLRRLEEEQRQPEHLLSGELGIDRRALVRCDASVPFCSVAGVVCVRVCLRAIKGFRILFCECGGRKLIR